jgi:hypothetical protein
VTASRADRSRRSRRSGRPLLSVALLAAFACGGAPPAASPEQPREQPAVTDTRTPIEKRRDAACEKLGPKITACAVEDARAALAAGKIQKKDFDQDTAPAVQHKNTDEFIKTCKSASYSTRQVRVLEVCFQEEPRCDPLLECLGHLNDRAPKSDAKP